MDGAFERAFDAALVRALPGVFRAAAVTAVAADATDPERLGRALARLLATLPRAGVPRGRVFVLLAATPGGAARERATARTLRAALGVPVLAHDPARSACFVAGTVDGLAVEVSDELREAEAVLALGPLAPRDGPRALEALVVPGLAARATRAALGARPGLLAAARATVLVDLALGWCRGARGAWSVAGARGGAAHP